LEPVILIEKVTKAYKLYDRNLDRLKDAVLPGKRQYHRLFYALKDISLSLEQGEILGLVGRNGAGKSTLLNIIAGITTPTSGHCSTRGRVSALLGLGTGFNLQLTGRENIFMNGAIMGYSKKEMAGLLEKILEFAEIGHYIDQPLRTYSSGMKARLGFAAAVHIDPEILILDEVLSVGDDLFRRKCFAKMQELFKSGCTVLFVSHNRAAITEICSRAILLDRGEMILEGSPRRVTDNYQLLLHEKGENRERFRQDLINQNRNNKTKNDSPAKETAPGLEPASLYKEEDFGGAYFIPGLEAKSRKIQTNRDIEILEACITTTGGQKVNCLIPNGEYVLRFRLRFNEALEKIALGYRISNHRGQVLGGGRFPGGKDYIDQVSAGETLALDWQFECCFLKGTYYVRLGIPHLADQEKKRALTAMDIIVFKVQSLISNERAPAPKGPVSIKQKLTLKRSRAGQ